MRSLQRFYVNYFEMENSKIKNCKFYEYINTNEIKKNEWKTEKPTTNTFVKYIREEYWRPDVSIQLPQITSQSKDK